MQTMKGEPWYNDKIAALRPRIPEFMSHKQPIYIFKGKIAYINPS